MTTRVLSLFRYWMGIELSPQDDYLYDANRLEHHNEEYEEWHRRGQNACAHFGQQAHRQNECDLDAEQDICGKLPPSVATDGPHEDTLVKMCVGERALRVLRLQQAG